MNTLSERRSALQKRRWTKAVLFVLVFVLIGCVIGAGATLFFLKDSFHRVRPQREAIVAAMLEKMREHVAVSGEEEGRLTALLDGHFDEIVTLREESFQKMRGVFDKMDASIESVLGADRFKTWYDYKEKRLAEFRERRAERERR
jgi:hypothetical protein